MLAFAYSYLIHEMMTPTFSPFSTELTFEAPTLPPRGKYERLLIGVRGGLKVGDVVGVAILGRLAAQHAGIFNEISTRHSEDELPECHFVLGSERLFDPTQGRFDACEKSGANLSRDNLQGNYSPAGLVWSTYGAAFVAHILKCSDLSVIMPVVAAIDAQFIRDVDAEDVAKSLPESCYGFGAMVRMLQPTIEEIRAEEDRVSEHFKPVIAAELCGQGYRKACQMAHDYLQRLVINTVSPPNHA